MDDMTAAPDDVQPPVITPSQNILAKLPIILHMWWSATATTGNSLPRYAFGLQLSIQPVLLGHLALLELCPNYLPK